MLRGAGKVMEMSNTHTTVGSGGDWAEQTGEHVCCLKGRGDQLLPRGNLGPAGAQCSDDSTEVGNLNFEAKFPELLNFGLKKFFFFFLYSANHTCWLNPAAETPLEFCPLYQQTSQKL